MSSHRQPSDALLTIRNLGKRYANGAWGIRDASASFQAGRMVAVLGPNGAGKSTLIHLLAGAIRPTEGSITIADPNLRIGWSSQRTTIDWYLNTRQNIEIGGYLYDFDRKTTRNIATMLLERFRLNELATTDVSMLSGGQQQRVQVARTLMSNPDIMLLDEPTAALDVESSADVLELIRERVRTGALALISSHDLGLLEEFCDDVLLILNQRVIVFQPMSVFLQSIAPPDVLTLSLAEPANADALAKLQAFHPDLIPEHPHMLRVTLPADISLANVITLLGDEVIVLEASRQRSTLRDVYLHFTTQGNPSCN